MSKLSKQPDETTQTILPKQGWSSSGYKGVYKRGCKWQVKINLHGRDTHVGVFDDKVEAAHHYDYHVIKAYGRNAYLNFPEYDYTRFTPKQSDRSKTRGKLCYRKAETIRARHQNGVDARSLAEEYNVSLTTVYKVLGMAVYRPRDLARVSVVYNLH